MKTLARAGLLVWALGCGNGPARDAVTVKVERGDLSFSSSFYGELEARTSHPILVPDLRNLWQVTVESVLPDGAKVKKGDTVLTFARGAMLEDLKDRETDLAVTEASFRKTKEQLEDEGIGRLLAVRRAQLAVEVARLGVVEGTNLVSRLELEKAKVELARAELQLDLERKEQASFQKKKAASLEVEQLKVTAAADKVKQLRDQLEQMEVKAPADGVLYAPYTRLNWQMGKAAPGKVARPSDKILELPELDRYNAVVYVRQRDASLIQVGDTAQVVTTLFPDRPLAAKVVSRDEFATTRNERTGTSTPAGSLKEVKVVLELEDTDLELRPGATVRADVSTLLASKALLLPLACLDDSGQGGAATLKNGRTVKLKLGKSSTSHAEVLEGLAEGDEVRLHTGG